jgi:uncharacterized protein YndB with AHSA1/START domain
MKNFSASAARAVADLTAGQILASVEIAAPPERVFRALTSKEIVDWWVNPGVFDTREWSGEVRKGGHWRASGNVRGQPYALEGEFLEVDPPTRLVHTWKRVGTPGAPTVVSYLLQSKNGGTRLTLRHSGFDPPESCATTSDGWEASLARLAAILPAKSTGGAHMTAQACAVAYFTALGNKDRSAIRKLLVDDGDFIGPLSSFTDADTFMKAADIFTQLVRKVEIKKVLADGPDVCVFWDYTTIVPSIPAIPVAAWIKVEGEKIRYFHLHFNPAAFVAAVERGDVAKALQSGAQA